MEITVKELKSKLNYYLDLAQNEDVFVVDQGKNIVKLSKATIDPVEELTGILSHVDDKLDTNIVKEELMKL